MMTSHLCNDPPRRQFSSTSFPSISIRSFPHSISPSTTVTFETVSIHLTQFLSHTSLSKQRIIFNDFRPRAHHHVFTRLSAAFI
mmetsp:Transcript_11060/g.41251  ORF Transcript_11060/g.41251 Transcript_11060/m.41251 type:complete len:84 (-) Transcript_11060:4745-4996(-)